MVKVSLQKNMGFTQGTFQEMRNSYVKLCSTNGDKTGSRKRKSGNDERKESRDPVYAHSSISQPIPRRGRCTRRGASAWPCQLCAQNRPGADSLDTGFRFCGYRCGPRTCRQRIDCRRRGSLARRVDRMPAPENAARESERSPPLRRL